MPDKLRQRGKRRVATRPHACTLCRGRRRRRLWLLRERATLKGRLHGATVKIPSIQGGVFATFSKFFRRTASRRVGVPHLCAGRAPLCERRFPHRREVRARGDGRVAHRLGAMRAIVVAALQLQEIR